MYSAAPARSGVDVAGCLVLTVVATCCAEAGAAVTVVTIGCEGTAGAPDDWAC